MRYGAGGVRKQRGKWFGFWREGGVQKSQVLGLASEMTKGEARDAVAEIVRRIKKETNPKMFGSFVEGPFFQFYTRKWKSSSADTTKQRILTHLVEILSERDMASIRRDELQDLLDAKSKTHSFSVVDHLRWDMKQIFDMAISEGVLRLNPAALLFTPNEAKRPLHRVMTPAQVKQMLEVLEGRERLIAMFAVLAGMRPGEIFALTWGRVAETAAKVTQRIYRGKIDTPKTHNSVREAALGDRFVVAVQEWGSRTGQNANASAFVFPSERGTALSKDNVWRRNIEPALTKVGLEWCNFQVMRRTHSTLMKKMKADPKAVADQLGHSVDVNQNVYTQTPVETRAALVNDLERLISAEPERCAIAVQEKSKESKL